MKVVILAGGLGTRLSEYTHSIPKPMIEVGDKPLLLHIMERYAAYGFKEFVIALGYKSEVIKRYFSEFHLRKSNFTVDLKSGAIKFEEQTQQCDWEVTLLDTGRTALTGLRIRRVLDFMGETEFMLTYGDGLGDVNIEELLKFHRESSKLVTVTAVRPPARFGELEITDFSVTKFDEKPQLQEGWINGGFFVFDSLAARYFKADNVMLEREPLNAMVNEGELAAYKHDGFWKCVDTVRDLATIREMWESGNCPWVHNGRG